MSRKLKKQVRLELQQLDTLLAMYRPLTSKVAQVPPDAIERSALAAMLHSFYTGFENIFKRIERDSAGELLTGASWHKALLDAMTKSTSHRSAVITEPTRQRLREYMEFRHFFRNAYTFQLNWAMMSPLVAGCQDLLASLRMELERFLATISDDD